jgi:hypothetical protein
VAPTAGDSGIQELDRVGEKKEEIMGSRRGCSPAAVTRGGSRNPAGGGAWGDRRLGFKGWRRSRGRIATGTGRTDSARRGDARGDVRLLRRGSMPANRGRAGGELGSMASACRGAAHREARAAVG